MLYQGRAFPCLAPLPLQLWEPGEYIRWFIDGTLVYGEGPLLSESGGRAGAALLSAIKSLCCSRL